MRAVIACCFLLLLVIAVVVCDAVFLPRALQGFSKEITAVDPTSAQWVAQTESLLTRWSQLCKTLTLIKSDQVLEAIQAHLVRMHSYATLGQRQQFASERESLLYQLELLWQSERFSLSLLS